MKSWTKCIADIVKLVPLACFSKGRSGKKIKRIVIHHNAGNLTVQGCYNAFVHNGTSAHYQVTATGRIAQHVYDGNTAYHAGVWAANLDSIGIEHADYKDKYGRWQLTDKTLDNGAHLVAALCVLYKLGRPTWKKNVFPHDYFYNTACPASLAGGQQSAYMRKAQAYYDQMTKKKSVAKAVSQTASRVKTTVRASKKALKPTSTVAREVIAGKWGNGQTRVTRLKKAGYNPAKVQAIVNKLL